MAWTRLEDDFPLQPSGWLGSMLTFPGYMFCTGVGINAHQPAARVAAGEAVTRLNERIDSVSQAEGPVMKPSFDAFVP